MREDILSQLDRITGELHAKVMKVRMVSLANVFQEFDQIIKAGKEEIEIDIEGENIEVEDDAKVINLKQLEAKIIENNILSKDELERLNKAEIYNLLLKDNNFSKKALKNTDKKITAVKNIKKIIEEINGDLLSNTKNIAGATIIGDGAIALIIDVRDIA